MSHPIAIAPFPFTRRVPEPWCRLGISLLIALPLAAQQPERTLPVFKDGQAQVVAGFADPATWIRQFLWVEACTST